MNDLPDIGPTGAMSSGDYVAYMMDYDSDAEDVIIDNLTEFGPTQTMEDWYALWGRVLGEVSTRISSIESGINTLNQQIKVVGSKLNKM